MQVVAVTFWLEHSVSLAFDRARGVLVGKNSTHPIRIPDIAQRLNFVMHHYLAFGLHIQSEFALPELMEHNAEGTPDVFICFGEVMHPEKKLPRRGSHVVSNSGSAYMYWSQIGTFHVQSGSTIQIDAFQDVPEQTIRLPLLVFY